MRVIYILLGSDSIVTIVKCIISALVDLVDQMIETSSKYGDYRTSSM